MKISRKTFLKCAALPVLAAATKAVAEVVGAGYSGELKRKRLAVVIDMSKCAAADGCTRCIDACHRGHNVPAIPDKTREIKWIWKEQFESMFPAQPAPESMSHKWLPVACNHCDHPPCTRACPTGATWKRDSDGIVMMDYHRCIGCRYCMAACPFGARSFNFSDPRPHVAAINSDYPTRTTGVVEKCDLCEERFAAGKRPLCEDACPQRAIVIGDVNDRESQVSTLLRSHFALRRREDLGTGPGVFYLI